jgi:hypothetical protein
MSRLDDEYIMAVVRNRSGVDSGEIDYSIKCDRFDRLSLGDLAKIIKTINELGRKCTERMTAIVGKPGAQWCEHPSWRQSPPCDDCGRPDHDNGPGEECPERILEQPAPPAVDGAAISHTQGGER